MRTKILLLFIFIFMVGFKIYAILNNQYFNPKDTTALFWTESALQYRTAKIVATHGCIPSLDKKLQYPEGLNIKNRLTILMEMVSGYIYRVFIPKTIPFHLFLIIFISFYSSLTIFPLYLLLQLVSKKREVGLLGTVFYAMTPAVYTAVIAPGYELQDFALPLIFFHLYFFIKTTKVTGYSLYSNSFLSASFLFAALTAWHLTQFYYVLFVLFIIICFFFTRHFDLKPFYITTAVSFLAGCSIPTLRSTLFLFSFPMLISYSLVISSLLPNHRTIYRRFLFICLSLIAILLTTYISSVRIPEYRFVYGLVLDKIRYCGIRPADPTALPWETLVMWVSPFTSPSLNTILYSIGALLVGGGISAVFVTRRLLNKQGDIAEGFFLYLTITFFSLYLLLIRLDVFLVWFLSLHAGRLFEDKKKIFQFILIVCICINGFLLFRNSQRRVAPERNYLLELLKYIRYNTPQDSPVLTSFAYGPSILTYTGRPILLHPKFEAEHITNKIKEFEYRLFEDESNFYSFCERYKAQYFVYHTDILLARGYESIRYRTHNLSVSKDCVTYKFHFRPDSLIFFELVYSNPHYRLYHVLERGERFLSIKKVYFRVYDERLFTMANFGIY